MQPLRSPASVHVFPDPVQHIHWMACSKSQEGGQQAHVKHCHMTEATCRDLGQRHHYVVLCTSTKLRYQQAFICGAASSDTDH